MPESTGLPNTAVLNADGTHVHMTHPDTGGAWDCPVEYAAIAQTRGWVFADPRDDSLDGLFDEPVNTPGAVLEGGAVQTGFNPDDHTVGEVNDYLATVDPAGGEAARVLELERNGKNRSTITGD